MKILDFGENADIINVLFQIADEITELERLIDNINVLSEEVYTCLATKTEMEWITSARDLEVSAIKTGMIREFVIRANENINELADLSDKSIDMI